MPILNILVILLLAVITLLWGIRGKGRGLFSSLIMLVCVVIAGAIAFGLWEPITMSVFMGWRGDLAWGLGLMIPFAVSLAILRLIAELCIPSNSKVDDASNFVGGAVLGFGAAVITTGILVLGLGSMNFGRDFLGHDPIDDTGGKLVYSNSLWVPVDEWTVKLYAFTSVGAFNAGDEALALRSPNLYEQVATRRMVYERQQEGLTRARMDVQEGEARVVARYASAEGTPLSSFLSAVTGETAQAVNMSDGSPMPPTSRMFGFVVEFQAAAGEETGNVVVGPGQIRLVYRLSNGVAGGAHPTAIVAAPEALAELKVVYPLNNPKMFIPTLGGSSTATMGFEFAVPPTGVPTDLIIKGLRIPLDTAESLRTFNDGLTRHAAIASGELFAGGGKIEVADLGRSSTVQANRGTGGERGSALMVSTGITLPFQFWVNYTAGTGGLDINTDIKRITGGTGFFSSDQLGDRSTTNNARDFDVTPDTNLIRVHLSNFGEITPVGTAVSRGGLNGKPVVFDTEGNVYSCVGYIYADDVNTTIRYTPRQPIGALSDITEGNVSSAVPEQSFILLFRPTVGVRIAGFAIDDELVGDFGGGIEITPARRPR